MSENRDTTCASRIAGELASREADLAKLLALVDGPGGDDQEEAQQEVDNYALSVEVERVVTIQISTGGPGDQLEATLDQDGDIRELRYRFLDWFDGAVVTVDQDENPAVWRYAENICELVAATGLDS